MKLSKGELAAIIITAIFITAAAVTAASGSLSGRSAPVAISVVSPAPPEAAPSEASELININTASAEELDVLPGIGEKLAAAIVSYRSEHGGFLSLPELMDVPGIGPEVFEKLRLLITV